MRQVRRQKPYNAARLQLVAGIFVVSFLAILLRLVIIQIIKHPHLRDEAMRQANRTITLRPERGRIADRNGSILATSVLSPSVYAIPPDIAKPEEVAKQLAAVLELPLTTVLKQLGTSSSFVWIARQVIPDKVTHLRALSLPGIHIVMETRRFYPKRHLAGQILGFVGIDEQGLGGLEDRYNQVLSGTPRQVVGQVDARRRRVRLLEGEASAHPRGADLRLTLDERLQYIAEKELAAQVEHTGAKQGLVVMMEPATGDILALALYPFFNPNDYRDPEQFVWRGNRSVTDPVEPGSTFKIVAAAAALQEKKVRPDDKIFCEKGVVYRGRTKRRLRDHHPYGLLNFAEVMEHSSNIGMVKVSEHLSREQFYDYIRRFGFGEKSNIDLPGENDGLLHPLNRWSDLSQDSLTIGQEIGVTPIQLITAFSAIANGGWLMRPRLVTRILSEDGERTIEPVVRQRVLLQQTAEQLTTLLTGVVERGTGKQAAVEGYAVAGKTGTAQKTEGGGYSHRKLLASFVGYVPADAPRLAILVMIDEPQKTTWGGTAAAPVFKRVAQQALHYLQIPPRYAHPLTIDPSQGNGIIAPALTSRTPGEANPHLARYVQCAGKETACGNRAP